MREELNRRDEDVLRNQYRKLLAEGNKLAKKDPKLAEHFYAEADKVIHKLAILQRQKRNSFTGNMRFA